MTNEDLLKTAKIWARALGPLPGVRAIFLSGSVAQGRVNEGSDIDFFIIARSGQIWTARFFVFLILQISGQMRSDKGHAGKICPNHFITDDALEIKEKDAYSANLFAHNQPLYDPENVFPHFASTNRGWARNFGESFPSLPIAHHLEARKVGFFWHWVEKGLKSVQIEKATRNPEYKIPGAKIVLEDTELRFHPKPKNKNFHKS